MNIESPFPKGTFAEPTPKPPRKTRSDSGKPRVAKPAGKTPAAALIDVLAALEGLTRSNIDRVLHCATVYHDLDGERK